MFLSLKVKQDARIIALFLAVFAVSFLTIAVPTSVPEIGVGGDEKDPHTHLRFEGIPQDAKIVSVSSHFIVDQVGTNGLNFFAIQVNFPNKTWAHGGPQLNSGVEMANWGGLVNRGGGATDYKELNWKNDLPLIECGIEKPNTVPWKWNRHCEYLINIERGKQVHIPAGTNDHFKVMVPEHTMWEWKLIIKPLDSRHEPFTSLLYDSADHISSFYLWNESGYGSTSNQQHARWSLPTFRTEDSATDKASAGWKRF